MADWGLYSALRGTDNWAQKRQDSMQSLMILEKRNQKAQEQLQAQNQMEEGINQYFDQMQKLDVLSQDQERINEIEKAERNKIYKGLIEHNGDLKSYMSSGGISAMHNYQNAIVNSTAAKNAALNKQMLSHYVADMSKGDKVAKSITVNVPVTDANGKPKLDKNGNSIKVPQQMSFDQQYALFQKGIIDTLNYSGAENKLDIKALDFAKVAKDPNNPFVASPVTTQDVYFKARSMGASDEYAKSIANSYYQMATSSGQGWHWNSDNIMENQLKAAKIAKLTGGGSGSSDGGNKEVLNALPTKFYQLPVGGLIEMGEKDRDWFQGDMGIKYDGERNAFVPTRNIKAYDAFNIKNEYDLGNAKSIVPKGYTKRMGSDGKEQMYIVADALYDADEPSDVYKNPHYERFFGDNQLNEGADVHNWQEYDPIAVGLKDDSFDTVVKGEVLIPIQQTIDNQVKMQMLNEFLNLDNRTHNAAASLTSSDMARIFMNDIDVIMEDNPKLDRQQAVEIMTILAGAKQ